MCCCWGCDKKIHRDNSVKKGKYKPLILAYSFLPLESREIRKTATICPSQECKFIYEVSRFDIFKYEIYGVEKRLQVLTIHSPEMKLKKKLCATHVSTTGGAGGGTGPAWQ